MSAGFIFIWAMLDLSDIVTTTVKAIWFSSFFLSVLCTFYFFVACVLAFHFSSVFFATLAFPIIWTVCESIFHIYRILSSYRGYRNANVVICLLYAFGGNMICYISCWLVIGMRINPSWGLTVALSIISIFGALTYAVYFYLEVIYPDGYDIRERQNKLRDLLMGTYTLSEASYRNPLSSSASNDDSSQNNNDLQDRAIALLKSFTFSVSSRAIYFCILGCIAVGSFFFMVILAGPSIAGQTSAADELLKTSSLYFIVAFITWATLKKHASIDTPLQNERPQNAEGQDTEHHTGDHPGGELDSLV